jgi:hypothetical protein
MIISAPHIERALKLLDDEFGFGQALGRDHRVDHCRHGIVGEFERVATHPVLAACALE